ncbi:MAG TPA: hypothetical protein VGQ51_03640 [Puia sp.]|jgi:hypothetical protein|nr:hypothetical protein [Puia sp.]
MKIGILCLLSAITLHAPAYAQLPVAAEKHHRVLLQNDYIRILDGHIPARDTTPVHLHAANSVVVFLSLSTFAIQKPGEPPVVTHVRPGDLKYAGYGDKPVNHIVWNESRNVFHFYVVELVKTHAAGAPCPISPQPGLMLQWKQPSVEAYYLEPPAGGSCRLPATSCARLLIGLSGTTTASTPARTEIRQPEGYVYFPPGTRIDIRGDHSRCILLEIR